MAKRLRSVVKDNGKLPAGYFRSKYVGTCKVCGYSFEKNEILHYVGPLIAHENCHGTTELNAALTRTEYVDRPEPAPSFVIIGERKPKLCRDCMLEHGVSQKECW